MDGAERPPPNLVHCPACGRSLLRLRYHGFLYLPWDAEGASAFVLSCLDGGLLVRNSRHENLDAGGRSRWLWVSVLRLQCIELDVEAKSPSNGQFEQTTADGENAYVKDGMLWIQPTLQNETLLATNTTLNLLNDGCTGTTWSDCVAVTNASRAISMHW